MDISRIYKQAWRITKENKALWVFGIALMFLSGSSGGRGGGGGGSGSGSDSNSNSYEWNQEYDPEQIREMVKGDSISPAGQQMSDGGFWSIFSDTTGNSSSQGLKSLFNHLQSIIADVPIALWVFLILSILISIIVGVIFAIILKNWVKGSLIGGINNSIYKKPVTIGSSSSIGLARLKQMIWLSVIPGIMIMLFLTFSLLILVMLYFSVGEASLFLLILVFPILFGAIIYVHIGQIMGERIIVFENKPWKQAFREGRKMFSSNVGGFLMLGFVNIMVGSLISFVIMMAFVFVGAIAFGSFLLNEFVGVAMVGFFSLFIIPAIIVVSIVKGLLVVFIYSTWNIYYFELINVQTEEKSGMLEGGQDGE